MIGQVQQVIADHRDRRDRALRVVQHLLAVAARGIEDPHRQVVIDRRRQAFGDQLTHAQQGHDEAARRSVPGAFGKHRRDHQQPARIGRLDVEHVQRRRHRHAARRPGALQGGLPQGLAKHVQAIGLAWLAGSLGIQHGVVVIARRGRLQDTLHVLVANLVGLAKHATGLAFECLALRRGYPWRPGVGLGAVQQRFDVAIELTPGDFGGVAEKPPQPIQALLLVIEALGDAAVAFAGQQLEALAQLLLVEGLRGDGQGRRQQRAGNQGHQRHRPGRQRLAEQAEHLRTHAILRHRAFSSRQRPANCPALAIYSYWPSATQRTSSAYRSCKRHAR
ncbi:hypothetical protein PSRE111525_27715 [Pseudomonas reidholzensis]